MKPIRTLVAPIVIAAMALTTATAIPARADTSDLAKVLLGVAAVAVVANAVKNNRNNNSTATSNVVTTRHDRDRVVYGQGSGRYEDRRASKELPERCLRTYEMRNGRQRELFSGHCLSRVPYRLAELPERCEWTVIGRGDRRGTAYGPRCLAKAGFKIAENANSRRHGDWDDDRDRSRHIVWGN